MSDKSNPFNQSLRLSPCILWLCLVLSLGACRQSDDDAALNNPRTPQAVALDHGTNASVIPEYPQRQGDVAKGRRALLNEPYVNCGLPYRVFKELLGDVPVVPAPGREGKAAMLPYSSTLFEDEQGREIVSTNCLSCHANRLFGELVIGLGNEFSDFTVSLSDLAEQAGAYVRTEEETDIWQRYADRILPIAPYMVTKTVGVNPANSLTMALIAHRDAESNRWLNEPWATLPTAEIPPVSVPPWWRMRKKHAMFSMGEGRGDHARIMMAAAMLCSDTRQDLEQIDQYAPDIRVYISSLEPPPYPFPIDETLSIKGEKIFNNTCSRCHGTYGETHTYPNRLVDIEELGTDPTLINFATGEGALFNAWFNRSYFGELSEAVAGRAYVAPPLDGVWATGPFLHNGSVPTVRALLNSTSRPTFWLPVPANANDPAHFNQSDIGWHHTISTTGQSTEPYSARRKRIYDTTIPGYSNSGHLFGDHLSDSDRSAVLEYIKTL